MGASSTEGVRGRYIIYADDYEVASGEFGDRKADPVAFEVPISNAKFVKIYVKMTDENHSSDGEILLANAEFHN